MDSVHRGADSWKVANRELLASTPALDSSCPFFRGALAYRAECNPWVSLCVRVGGWWYVCLVGFHGATVHLAGGILSPG